MWKTVIYFDEEPLENNETTTFTEQGINDGARLSIQFKTRSSFNDVLEDIIRLNPHIIEHNIREQVSSVIINPEDPSHLENDLNLRNLYINFLPESFGYLNISGNIYLGKNRLTCLPDTFANLNIEGDLMLNHNQLTKLPDNFSDLKVGQDLDLGYNQLTSEDSWPKNFERLVVGGDLYLGGNKPPKTKKRDYPNVNGEIYLV